MNTQKLPNFIIGGVARCGTTSLYHYLLQHPEITFPKQKEPKYFSSIHLNFPHLGPGDDTVDKIVLKDKQDYLKLFKNLDTSKCIGEASSDYLYFHKYTVEAIKKELGDIPIIFSLRNPIDRAYSAYNNLLRDGRETLSFAEAIKKEDERILDNWDWMWAYKNGGLYADAIEHFQQEFTNVKVVIFDELESEPNKVLSEIFEFLNVDLSCQIDCGTKYSHSGKPKNFLVSMLTTRNNKLIYFFRQLIIKMIPRSLLESIASKLFKKDDIELNTKKELYEFFKKDIKRLEIILNKDLTAWKKL